MSLAAPTFTASPTQAGAYQITYGASGTAHVLIYLDQTAWDDFRLQVTSDTLWTEFEPYRTITDGYAIKANINVLDTDLSTSEYTGMCITVDSFAASCWTATKTGTSAYTFSSHYEDLSSATAPAAGDSAIGYSAPAAVTGVSLDGFAHTFSCATTSVTDSGTGVITDTLSCYLFQPADADSTAASYRFDSDSPSYTDSSGSAAGDGLTKLWTVDSTGALADETQYYNWQNLDGFASDGTTPAAQTPVFTGAKALVYAAAAVATTTLLAF